MQDFSHIKGNHDVTFGSDPEIFSRDSKGQIKPAYTFLPPKTSPLRVEGEVHGFDPYIYNDGFQAELRASPHGCIAYLVDSIRHGLKAIWEKSDRAALVIDNAPQIPINILRDAPEENVILGCDPSMNAYHMGGACPGDPRALRYRFTGMHIHMSGWQLPETIMQREKLFVPYVKALDKVLGVFFVAAGAHLESAKRREYYGLAGEYRLPEHGLEYRVLSSVALSHPGITNLAFEIARGVVALVLSRADKLWIADQDETIGVINSNNQKAARSLITRNKDLFNIICNINRSGTQSYFNNGDAAYKLSQRGIDSIIDDPNDFVRNWKFKGEWFGHGGQNESWAGLCLK